MRHDKPTLSYEKPMTQIDVDALIDTIRKGIHETLYDTLKSGGDIWVEANKLQIVADTGEVMLNARIPKWAVRALHEQFAPPAGHHGTPAGRVARPKPGKRKNDPEAPPNEQEG
jgi:hypothetical protein